MKIARASLQADFDGLSEDIGYYGKMLGKEPGKALQRHGRNMMFHTSQEFKRLSPSKEDISLQALYAQRKRKRRKGTARKRIDSNSAIDLASGAVLGLKIRPTVFAQAKAKFGFASDLKLRARREKKAAEKGKKLRATQHKEKRVISQGGKAMNITSWMIAREIATRRSGIKYLGHAFTVPGFKAGDRPRTRPLKHTNRYGKLVATLDQVESKTVSSVRIGNELPEVLRVGRARGVFKRGIKKARLKIRTDLIRGAKREGVRLLSNLKRIAG